jgi:hypothetical protein
LNSWHTPDWTLKIAWLAGVRRSMNRLSSFVSWLTVAIFSPRASAAATSASERAASAISNGRIADRDTTLM